MNQIQKIENVAIALYRAEGEGLSWEDEPEILKSEFRRYAHVAIALLHVQEEGKRAEIVEAA
jgi:hypothetical protein